MGDLWVAVLVRMTGFEGANAHVVPIIAPLCVKFNHRTFSPTTSRLQSSLTQLPDVVHGSLLGEAVTERGMGCQWCPFVFQSQALHVLFFQMFAQLLGCGAV